MVTVKVRTVRGTGKGEKTDKPLLGNSWFRQKKKKKSLFNSAVVKSSGVPRGGVWGVQPPLPEIPKALQNCAKLNPIVKTLKNF